MSELSKFLESVEPKPFDKSALFAPEPPTPPKVEEPEPIVEIKAEEKKIPFNEDPKIQRFIEREVERKLGQYQAPVEKPKSKHSVVSAFEAIIGNDKPEKVQALDALNETLSEYASKAERAEQIALEREQEMVQEAEIDNQFDNGFASIKSNFNVDLDAQPKVKAQFLDFVKTIAPRDEDGDITDLPNFAGAFEAFKKMSSQPSASALAKTFASRTVQNNGGTPAPQSQPINWKTIDKMFNR